MTEDMQATIADLTKRLAELEGQLASREIPEDHLVAIAAAVSAFLGCKAKIRQIRLQTTDAWSRAARSDLHNHQPVIAR